MPASKRILLIEPSGPLAGALENLFAQHKEFSLTGCDGVSDGIRLWTELGGVDVVLLAMGGVGEATVAAQELMTAAIPGPFVFLSHGPSDSQEFAGTQLPAPFRFGVLLAHLRYALRMHDQSAEATIQLGPYRFAPSEKMLSAEGADPIILTDKEAGILKSLNRAPNQTLSRDGLLEAVWGYNSGVTTHTLETHIYRLRQKIEPNPGAPSYLQTADSGYRLATD